jgi:transcriptional repressor NrdR
MVCPYCKKDSQVVNSRHQKRANSVWRRRKCTNCGAIWTSVEHIDYATVWRVSKGKHLVDFTPETLYVSLYEALKHKKTAVQDAKHICDTVLQKLAAKHTAVLPADLITQSAHDILRRYDKTAAAVYKATHDDRHN